MKLYQSVRSHLVILYLAVMVLGAVNTAHSAENKKQTLLPQSTKPVKTTPAKALPKKRLSPSTSTRQPLTNSTMRSPGFFMVTSPGTGARWRRTTIQTIEWMQPESMDDKPMIRLVYNSYEYIVSYHSAGYNAATKKYSVRLKIPGDIPVGSRCKVRITGYTKGRPRTCESGFFTIEQNRINSIQVQTPNGGQRLYYGDTPNIVWIVDGEFDSRTQWEVDLIKGGRVLVTYPQRSLYSLMVHPETGRCSFKWTVTFSLEPGDDYEIAVRAAGTRVEDRSDGPFSIVGRRDGVDLWVTTFSTLRRLEAEEGQAEPGWRFSVDYSLYNSGGAPAPTSDVGVYLSDNTGLSSDDILLKTVSHSQDSASHTCFYMGGTFITVPDDVVVGRRYYVIFKADYNSRVTEFDERNNVSTRPAGGRYHPPPSFVVRAPSSRAKDLRADNIRVSPLSFTTDGTHRLVWRYSRIAYTFPVDAYSFQVRVIMSDDNPATPDVVMYNGTEDIPARTGGMNTLGGGRYIDFSFPEPGRFHFRMILDETDRVDELDETNNAAALDYVVEE